MSADGQIVASGRRGGRFHILVIAGTVGLVAVPVAVDEFPRETARWFAAAATERALERDSAGAIQRLDRALAWDPANAEFFLVRAAQKLDTKQWASGLADCDAARRIEPGLRDIGELRSQLLQQLGQHRAAVGEWKQMFRDAANEPDARRAQVLNGLAYAQAVGGLELEEALKAVNEGLAILGTDAIELDPGGYLLFARGYSALQNEDLGLALSSLDQAVEKAENAYRRHARRWKALASERRDGARFEERVQALKPHLAGVLQLRSEVLQKLDRPAEAERDRKRVEELASNGNISMNVPLPLSRAVQRVESVASYLDTRGYIYVRLADPASAIEDLEHAVTLIQWVRQAFPWHLDFIRHEILDIRPLLLAQEKYYFTEAVIRYHRMLAYEASGKKDLAARDREAILDLGFEPGPHLF
jgi:tetratricopeptide (TPR) repeat protein